MKTIILPTNTAAHDGFTHLCILTHEDLTEAVVDTEQIIPLLTVAAGDAVFRAAAVLRTAFADESDEAFDSTLIAVGETTVDRFIASTEINGNGTEVLYGVNPSTAAFVFAAADTIDISFALAEESGKALVDIDTGELHVYLGLVDRKSVV